MADRLARSRFEDAVEIDTGAGIFRGSVSVPESARDCVIVAHASGSGRVNPRHRFVASALHQAGIATLLMDFETAEDGAMATATPESAAAINLIADRLLSATDWLTVNFQHHDFRIGYFAADSATAAALVAAARRPTIAAVVSRGGRPDLAGDALPNVCASILLIVGGKDRAVIKVNREALARMTFARNRELRLIPGAKHLFKEAGALEEVARLATQWFSHYLGAANPHVGQPHFGMTRQTVEKHHGTQEMD